MKFAELNGARLASKMFGDGTPIVLAFHGWTALVENLRLLADNFLKLIMGMAVALTILGCSTVNTGWQYIPNDEDSARWWISSDDMRSLIVDRTSNDAHYFDNTPGRLCFRYSVTGISGEWLPVPGQDGLFSAGSNVRIGVAAYHHDELPGPVDETILNRAAALLERDYSKLFGPISVTLTPYQQAKLKAIRWDVTWEMIIYGESALVGATKILMEYGSEWVVQISVTGTEDDFVIVDQIVNSFHTSDASDCFWPEIFRMLADIGGF